MQHEPSQEELAALRNESDFDAPAPKPAKKRKSGDLQSQVNYMPDIHRMLPASSDAEQGVLASFLLAPREVGYMCAEKGVTVEAFHIPAHALIFEVLWEMWDKSLPIDFITLTESLRAKSSLDQCGGAAFVTGLFTFLPTAANAAYYIETILEKATMRAMIKVGTQFAANAYECGQEAMATLDKMEQAVLAIRPHKSTAKSQTAQQAVMGAMERIQEAIDRKGGVSGLSTGFEELDLMTDGLHEQELVIIAARPTIGKTAFAMNIAEHIAVNLNLPVGVFSLEMSTEQLTQRLICSRAYVNLAQVRRGEFDGDQSAIASAGAALSKAPIFFEEGSDMTIQELRARARRLRAMHGIRAIFIDSLSVLKSVGKSDERQREVAEACNGCKEMAKELHIPVVLIAHLGRKSETRERPLLSDLRESGNIEQDADTVLFVDRPEERAEKPEDRARLQGLADVIIAKQRSGPNGTIPLTYLKEFTRFVPRSFSGDDRQPELLPDPKRGKRKDG